MTRGIDDAVSAETQILKENRTRKKRKDLRTKWFLDESIINAMNKLFENHTLKEMSNYSNIGINSLHRLLHNKGDKYVIKILRKKLYKYLTLEGFVVKDKDNRLYIDNDCPKELESRHEQHFKVCRKYLEQLNTLAYECKVIAKRQAIITQKIMEAEISLRRFYET